jgi:type VI secretion system secreted protein VgrG
MLKRRIHFHSDAVPKKGTDDGLLVSSFTGTEELSQPFSFTIQLVCKPSDEIADFSALLNQNASLEITAGGKPGGSSHCIHGVLSSFALLAKGGDWVRYEAVLVPPIWYLTLSRHTRIFMDKSVPDIVEEVFAAAKIPASSYEFNLKNRGAYPKSEYLVQYQETDSNFVARLLEKEGIFYYFKHDDKTTKLVFGDHTNAFQVLAPSKTVPLRAETPGGEGGGDQWEREEVVFTLTARQNVVPTEVVLKDYNYRKPGGDLKVKEKVPGTATMGAQYEYGHHYKDADDGRRLAKVRAEEAACRAVVFSGTSDLRGLRGGTIYQIEKRSAPKGAAGEESLVIQVNHKGQQGLEVGSGAAGGTSYRNDFVAIPQKTPFRPARIAVKPSIAGSMHALVDSGTSGEYADVDKEGRYLVALPFDLSGAASGKGSRYVRMAQPYGGNDMGMHFPLHKGTEVLLTHIDGDPDRPIIAAAVPNPETPSLIHQDTHTQAVIKTGGNNELRFDDAKGSEKVYLHAQKDCDTRIENNESKHIGASQSVGVAANQDLTVGGDQTQSITGNQTATIGKDRSESVGGSHSLSIGANQSVTVAVASTESIGVNKALTIGAAYEVTVGAAMAETVGGVRTETVGAASFEIVAGNKSETIGGKHDVTIAKDASATIGGASKVSVTKDYSIKAKKLSIDIEDELSIKVGSATIMLKQNGDITINGKKITIKGDGDLVLKGSKIVEN